MCMCVCECLYVCVFVCVWNAHNDVEGIVSTHVHVCVWARVCLWVCVCTRKFGGFMVGLEYPKFMNRLKAC